MQQIKSDVQIEIIEKKSRFITRLIVVQGEEEIKDILDEIVKSEKGAVHNCYAYRLFMDKKIIERKSDDGEPGGTAGAPMLAVLTGNDMVNILAVTTRYFGGIKLGTGGLVSVYKRGVKEALQLAKCIDFKVLTSYKVLFPINKTRLAEYLAAKYHLKVVDKVFLETVTFIMALTEDDMPALEDFKNQLQAEVICMGDEE